MTSPLMQKLSEAIKDPEVSTQYINNLTRSIIYEHVSKQKDTSPIDELGRGCSAFSYNNISSNNEIFSKGKQSLIDKVNALATNGESVATQHQTVSTVDSIMEMFGRKSATK